MRGINNNVNTRVLPTLPEDYLSESPQSLSPRHYHPPQSTQTSALETNNHTSTTTTNNRNHFNNHNHNNTATTTTTTNTAPSSSRQTPLSTSSVVSYMKHGIETEQLELNLFEVTMHLYGITSNDNNNNIDDDDDDDVIQDIMDIIGNPDFLRLWCEPIRSLIITSSSEGARNATNRRQKRKQQQQQQHQQSISREETKEDRAYDGEWIEASTPTLLNPSSSPLLSSLSSPTTCCYSYVNSLWRSVLGFPTYGKITMFVERQRGRVGLTIGRFADGRTAFHTIVVEKINKTVIRIKDLVRIDHRDGMVSSSPPLVSSSSSQSSSSFQPSASNTTRSCPRCCWSSKLDGYIAQTAASMSRLRLLIENGESDIAGTHTPTPTMSNSTRGGESTMMMTMMNLQQQHHGDDNHNNNTFMDHRRKSAISGYNTTTTSSSSSPSPLSSSLWSVGSSMMTMMRTIALDDNDDDYGNHRNHNDHNEQQQQQQNYHSLSEPLLVSS